MLWGGGLRWLRLFAGIICVLIFLLGVLFSLSNQETIVVKLLPFAFIVEAPIYLILLIVLFIGVFWDEYALGFRVQGHVGVCVSRLDV